jgi:anti-sigma factor RsiW
VEAHLETCPPCRIYLAQMRATIRAVGTVPVETLSDEACDALLAAFRDRP